MAYIECHKSEWRMELYEKATALREADSDDDQGTLCAFRGAAHHNACIAHCLNSSRSGPAMRAMR